MTLPSVREILTQSAARRAVSMDIDTQGSRVPVQMKLAFILNPVNGYPARPHSQSHGMSAAETAKDSKSSSSEFVQSDVPRLLSASNTSARVKRSRVRWTAAEDARLVQLVQQHGARHWDKLAAHFDARNGSQLRSRWTHRLADMSSSRPFSASEDEFIMQEFRARGASWTRIAERMERRLAHDVLNRCRLLLKRHASAAKKNTSQVS
mmetsp:Transcript_6667/g.17937  ORF Transcript_6667/g.17937 Transcript_6667/m.17937 type:complete len:208 (+) Transcript_6667:258-881(+)|eukprot:CAMPEP_0185835168 /NCGR_PEP_ID=MMETSP1353-20130828/7190_1 /TAXON_ID=1077150 /ORGANISM="Erythrolobus australicus, Strain CCMP3124" /LENGTH=207 /DNA_ID=CAMNT_0028533747 /DNA_START=242 /DNA_END=865 /DNA_ORIENTATION=+